ncbi:MAG TPA: M28 family peptidase [Kofleriaceae bacterium]|jgi:hypothetical protein
MKRACGLLIATMTACGTDGAGADRPGSDGGAVADGGGSGADAATAACRQGDPFDPAALEADVRFLASDEMRGRAPDTPEDVAARAFVAERFACLGLAPGMGQSFQQPFTAPDDLATANVVGVLRGGDPALAGEIIVVGAHHDHLGEKGGKIYNGANDNASGVAVLLAMAKAMVTRSSPPRRTIVFATFGYEENDGNCLGSEHYAAHPPDGLPVEDVVYMVNADMLGTYPSEGQVVAYGSLPDTPARLLLDDLAPASDLDVRLGNRADNDSSDFQAFCDLGVPYIYFETWDRECYHRPCDDADRLDYPHMSAIGALLSEVLVGLADGDGDLAAARGAAPCPL